SCEPAPPADLPPVPRIDHHSGVDIAVLPYAYIARATDRLDLDERVDHDAIGDDDLAPPDRSLDVRKWRDSSCLGHDQHSHYPDRKSAIARGNERIGDRP